MSSLQNQIYAQSNEEDFEVYLSFRYRGIINSIVVSYYKDDIFYLPINGLFQSLGFDVNTDGVVVTGNFSESQIFYELDLERQVLIFGEDRISLTTDDYLLKELDYFLSPKIFEQVFDLAFQIDFNNLTLELDTEVPIPVVERRKRSTSRLVNTTRFQREETYHPLEYGLNRELLNGGFLDYSSTIFSNISTTSIVFNSSIGLQLLGGDLQGTQISSLSSENSTFLTDNMRWRYRVRNTPALTTIEVGELNLNGVFSAAYDGIRLSNEPIESRLYFDEYEIEGITSPESEVELYLNNTLINFQQADELGNYRLIAPLYYGTSQLDLRIYSPTGQFIQQSKRIQIPFSFNQKGEFLYDFNIGRLQTPLIGSFEKNYAIQGSSSLGLSNWLTAKLGVEYFDKQMSENDPSINGGFSGRLFTNHIFILEGVSKGYIRTGVNAIYSNSSSFSVNYYHYTADNGIYNQSGNKYQFITNLFIPIRIGSIPISFRTSTFTRSRNETQINNLRLDLNTKIDKFSLKIALSDSYINNFNIFKSTQSASLNSSLTYSFSRNPNVPKILSGTFLRFNYRHRPNLNLSESFEILASKNVFKNGRFQASYGHNFITDASFARVSFVVDLGKTRSTSTASSNNANYSFTQNVRGSVGYDSNYNNWLFSSRNQVGRSAAAVRLFVDNDNDNQFSESDQLIPEGKMRIGRSGSFPIYKNGVLYYTQMQSYFQYNMEMNKGSLNNPMLVPELEQFSLVAAPNTFKKIEIPFYMSGVIEGTINRIYEEGVTDGIGGVKLLLEGQDNGFNTELRTFSDGSFYAYEIPPGNYSLRVDNNQLAFLGATSNPSRLEFEVQALPQGDFVEGLSIGLYQNVVEDDSLSLEQITIAQVTDEIRTDPEILEYSQEVFGTIDDALRFIVRAQNAFYSKNIDVAFRLVSESLELFETAQGHALKGSFYYFEGNIEQAQRHWEQALRFNPDLYIPDMETLEERITTSASD